MQVLVATDAWHPQINGVVRSLEHLASEAPSLGADIAFLTPSDFRSMPMPGYREIRLALARPGAVRRAISAARPDAVHIATEGPVGWMARYVCRTEGYPFTTSYHTRFPEYLAARLPVPLNWSYAALRRFHNSSAGTMVGSPTLERDLKVRGFSRLMPWSRGVNADLFRPRCERPLTFPKPVFLFVGRLAVEKNIEGFLKLDLPGSIGCSPCLRPRVRSRPSRRKRTRQKCRSRASTVARRRSPSRSLSDFPTPIFSARGPAKRLLPCMPPRTFWFFQASPTPSGW
jgi:glycosyltransferase involved in cell wall biosynthesis